MKIFLHIGIEKSGTTTIQDFLRANQKRLQEQGIGISQSLGSANNVLLAAYAMNHDRSNSVHIRRNLVSPTDRSKFEKHVAENFMREVASMSTQVQSIVLSNEHCHSNLVDRQELAKLKELLFRVSQDITVIVYLRRQIDVCVSHYSTLLRLGYTIDLDQHVEHLSLTHFTNYLELVNLWADVFTKERIKVRIFDRQKLLGRDLVTDFCDAIELEDHVHFELPSKLNKSLKPNAQRLLLKLNRSRGFRATYFFGAMERVHKRLRPRLESLYSGKGHMPSREIAIKKQSIFDASNSELSAIYLNAKDSVFSTSFDEYPE